MARIKSPPFSTLDAARKHFESLSMEAKVEARRRAREILADREYPSYSEVYYGRRLNRELQNTLKDAWAVVREVREMSSIPVFTLGSRGQDAFFTITDAMMEVSELIAEIDTFYETIDQDFSGNETVFVRSGLIEEAIASSQFEGASTTTDAAMALLSKGKQPKDESQRMIVGNLRLMAKAWELRNEDFSVDLVLQLHSQIASSIDAERYRPGQLRTTDDVEVHDADGTVHVPPPHRELEAEFVKIATWFQHSRGESTHSWIVGAILHFLVGWLHPFYDGNGRVGRAMFYWVMFKDGYDWFKFVSISRVLQGMAGDYVAAYLKTEKEPFDLTYFVDQQARVLGKLLAELRTRSFENHELLLAISDRRPTNKSLVDRVAQEVLTRPVGYGSVESVAGALNAPSLSVRRALNKLVAEGYFKKTKRANVEIFSGDPDFFNRLSTLANPPTTCSE